MFDGPMRHRWTPVAIACLLAFGATPTSMTGTWGSSDREGSGGRLLTKQDGGKVEFELECWRGAPSYNSGRVSGEFLLSNNRGVFRWDDKENRIVCELEFVFSADSVAVRYLNESWKCGFGANVSAERSYPRRSTKPPKFRTGPNPGRDHAKDSR